jgi:hypothetical protein
MRLDMLSSSLYTGKSLEEMAEIFGDEVDISAVHDHREDEKLETEKA